MATFTSADELENAVFRSTSLRGARFVACDLSGVVARAVDLDGADLDAPWLTEEGATLIINGVDVVPFVDAELNRRFPGRELRRAHRPGRSAGGVGSCGAGLGSHAGAFREHAGGHGGQVCGR